MIRRPDAAYIKEAGRFYLQVGYDEFFVKGQSAYTGTSYIPSDKIRSKYSTAIEFINDQGDIIKTVSKDDTKEEKNAEDLGEELNNVLRYIIDLANHIGFKYQQLWLDNVPQLLYLENLQKKYNTEISKNIIMPLIGEYDDPKNQKQGPVSIDLTRKGNLVICGNVGSGKTTLLSTIIYSSITTHNTDELNIYILDFGAETLRMFSKAPQVGNFMSSSDSEEIEKFFYYLEHEVNKRKSYYSMNGGSFHGNIEKGIMEFPNILVFINSIDVFREVYENIFDDLFSPITRDSSRLGVTFIVTSNLSNSLPIYIEGNFPQKIALHFIDNTEYTTVFNNTNGVIPADNPGRGLIELDSVYEFQTAMVFNHFYMEKNLSYVIEKLNQFLKKNQGIPKMPKLITIGTVKDDISTLDNVPIGINIKSNCTLNYNFNEFITPILYSSINSLKSFEVGLIEVLTNVKDTKVIVFDALCNISQIENAQIYTSNFKNLGIAVYNNILKKKEAVMGEKIVIIISGYKKIQSHLKKLQSEDENTKTIDDIINVAKETSNFKFILIEDKEFESVDDTSWSEYFDYNKGILVATDVESQELIQVDNDYSDIKVTRDVALAIVDSKINYVKFVKGKE